VADDEKEDAAQPAQTLEVAAAMDRVLDAAHDEVAAGRPDEHELQIRISTGDEGWARVELTLDGPSVHDGAGNSRLELPPVVAPKTELRA